MHAATCPAMEQPVTMTRRTLHALMWISAKVGDAGQDDGKSEVAWYVTETDDPDGDPPQYIELRYGGAAPEVDVMVFSDLAYMVIGYCVAHGIKCRDSGQIVEDWMREDAAKDAPRSEARH